jgi:hypothetical protein
LRESAARIGQYLDFLLESHYMKRTRHIPEFGYAKKDQPSIENIFTKFQEMISDLSRKREGNNKLVIGAENNIDHILGNYALMGQRMVEGRRMERNIATNYPLSPGEKENMRDLTPEDFEIFKKFKEEWDLILYYLDFLEGKGKENEIALRIEVGTEKGYLEKFKRFYKAGEILAMGADTQLAHFNFFTRLEGWDSTRINEIKGLEKIRGLIDPENFDKCFEKLAGSELLDKQAIFERYIKPRIH